MIVHYFGGGPMGTSAYLAYDREGGCGLMVDAPLGTTRRIVSTAADAHITILYVVSTHGHWDNNADNVALTAATGAQLLAHSWDSARLADPSLTSDEELARKIKPSRPDRFVGEGEALEVGTLRLEVWHTPGHTPGSLCLYEATQGVVFTGDTLQSMKVGQTDLPGGNSRQLVKSLLRLATLPDNTKVYPGHGITTNIKSERWLLELATAES